MTRGSSGMATSFYKVPYQHQVKESPCRFSTFAGNYNHKVSKSPLPGSGANISNPAASRFKHDQNSGTLCVRHRLGGLIFKSPQ
jgi:hypothetical protein